MWDLVDRSKGVLSREQHERINAFVSASWSANTKRAYKSDWERFTTWCTWTNRSPLPASPSTVAAFLADQATNGCPGGIPCLYSTIKRRCAAISQAHQLWMEGVNPDGALDYVPPTRSPRVHRVLEGIRRSSNYKPTRKAPLMLEHLLQILPTVSVHDRALLLTAWAGAFRRSEVCAVEIDHVQFVDDGVTIFLPETKTDKSGEGVLTGISRGKVPVTCPVRAMRKWLAERGDEPGRVFRLSPYGLSRLVKRSVVKLGLDPERYAAHSLRAGFITEAATRGIPGWAIKRQTRHKSDAVLATYIRAEGLFEYNVSGMVGL